MTERPDTIIQELVDQGRVLVRGRILPSSGPLTDAQVGEVRRLFVKHCNEHGIEFGEIAGRTGLSVDAVKAFWQNQAGDQTDALTRTLNGWMEIDARRRQSKLPRGYVETTIASEVNAVVAAACTDEPAMAAIIAPSGCGKTLVMKAMAARYHGHYLAALDGYTPRTLAIDIGQLIGARSPHTGGAVAILRRVIEALKGTRRPLFIDEAHRLRRDVFSTIRSIHDLAEVPVVLAGTADILDHVNDRAEGRGQFASRCLQYNIMEHVMDADGPRGGPQAATGRPLFTIAEVREYLEGMNVRFDEEGLRMAWAVACLPNHGCLRTVRRCVLLIQRTKAEGETITRRDFAQALSLLFGQQGRLIADTAKRQQTLAASA